MSNTYTYGKQEFLDKKGQRMFVHFVNMYPLRGFKPMLIEVMARHSLRYKF